MSKKGILIILFCILAGFGLFFAGVALYPELEYKHWRSALASEDEAERLEAIKAFQTLPKSARDRLAKEAFARETPFSEAAAVALANSSDFDPSVLRNEELYNFAYSISRGWALKKFQQDISFS